MGCFGSQEYDAAQDRGEVKRNGGDRSTVEDRNTASAADLGLKRPDIHDFRQIAAAEDAEIRLAQEYDAAQDRGGSCRKRTTWPGKSCCRRQQLFTRDRR